MFARAWELTDNYGLYKGVTRPGVHAEGVRHDVARLSYVLSRATLTTIGETSGVRDDEVLCAIILRGGLLLYPGFAAEFAASDFCLLGMRREQPDKVICEYLTSLSRLSYSVVVLADCVAATGNTLLTAREILAGTCQISTCVAAVICASRQATATLRDAGINVVGFSLSEDLDGSVVTPDLGELDAGDLFSCIQLGRGSLTTNDYVK